MFINTETLGNISHISRSRLIELADVLEDETTLSRDELLAIATELFESSQKGTMESQNLERMVYILENNKTEKLWQVQNVLADYAVRARNGKRGGTRRVRKARKSRKARKVRKN